MSILVLFEMDAAPGRLDDLTAMLAEQLPDTRRFDGCESVTVHRDQDAPDRLTLVERWSERAKHQAYVRWRTDRGDVGPLAALLAGPPAARYFDDVEI